MIPPSILVPDIYMFFVPFMWLKPCHELAVTGNGQHTIKMVMAGGGFRNFLNHRFGASNPWFVQP